jgi:acyl carrier protein
MARHSQLTGRAGIDEGSWSVAGFGTFLRGLSPPRAVPEELQEGRIRRVVADQLGVSIEELGRDVSLTDDLAVDSLDMLDLALALRDELGVVVPDSAMVDVCTYGELVDATMELDRERRAAESDAACRRPPPWAWVRILPPPSTRKAQVERAGWLTPYTVQTIAESVSHAGPGTRLEVRVPPTLSERALRELDHRFVSVAGRRVEVSVFRDPDVPTLQGEPASA